MSKSSQEIKFTDGKYNGKLVVDIIKSDPSYCHFYLFKYKGYKPKELTNLLKHNFPNENDYFMSFGPFKGKSLSWIYQNEPDYIDYLMNDEYVKINCKVLYQKLKEIENVGKLNE